MTGATGFLGSHLTRRLLADGWDVALLTRSSSRVPDDLRQVCRIVRSDVAPEEFAVQVGRAAPDVCFHLATRFVGVHEPGDVDPLVEANIGLGTRLADALSRLEDVAFVNVGTVWQHHDARPYGPSSLYAATKQAFVDVLQYFAECTPLRAVTVELCDTYGPGDERGKLLDQLVRAHRSGQPMQLSPGEQLVDFTHVDDVVESFLHAVRYADHAASPFAVSSAEIPLREFVALVGEVLGGEVPVEWGARPYRPREMLRSWAYSPPLPGWAPRVGLREGLAAVVRGELSRRPGTGSPR